MCCYLGHDLEKLGYRNRQEPQATVRMERLATGEREDNCQLLQVLEAESANGAKFDSQANNLGEVPSSYTSGMK